LKQLNLSQLNEVYLELELLIREYSETLISELALRDELEYEKELKNTFISLLLSVQSRRRQEHVRARQQNGNGGGVRAAPPSKFLTTVIPYHMEMGTPSNHALQVLIKSKYSMAVRRKKTFLLFRVREAFCPRRRPHSGPIEL